MMLWNEILCLGDSLTYGARDEYGRSYPAELARLLTERTAEVWFCHNYGVNGETSSDLLRRAWQIFKSFPKVKMANLLIGTNDIRTPIPTEIFRDNIIQILYAARAHDITLIVGTLPPVEFHPSMIKNREYIDIYNAELRQLAATYSLPLCDLSSLGDHLVDGVHFNHAGYLAMAELWASIILAL